MSDAAGGDGDAAHYGHDGGGGGKIIQFKNPEAESAKSQDSPQHSAFKFNLKNNLKLIKKHDFSSKREVINIFVCFVGVSNSPSQESSTGFFTTKRLLSGVEYSCDFQTNLK